MGQPPGATVWKYVLKLMYVSPGEPATPCLRQYLTQLNAYIQVTGTRMFPTAVVIRAQTWKQHKRPSTVEQVNCGTAHNEIPSSLIRKKKLLILTTFRDESQGCKFE